MKQIFHLAFFFMLGLSFPSFQYAQDVRVNLFHGIRPESFTLNCTEGECIVSGDGREISSMKQGDILYLEYKEGYIRVTTTDRFLGNFRQLVFHDFLLNGRYMIRVVRPATEPRSYSGKLEIGVENEEIKIINTLDLDQYLAGIIENETATPAPAEFYKLKAVLFRTQALKNWSRHRSDGYNFCDDDHCMKYRGWVKDDEDILHSVFMTHGILIADYHYRLINPVMHKNSGGETINGGHLSEGNADYLLPIIDPFSAGQPGYRWRDSLSLDIWLSYLGSRDIDTSKLLPSSFLVEQLNRKDNLIIGKDTLLIAELSEDLGFQSDFFTMYLKNDSTLLIDGKGSGHGAGISMEGALKMAEEGYSFENILNYYYFNVQVRHWDELPESSLPDEINELILQMIE